MRLIPMPHSLINNTTHKQINETQLRSYHTSWTV